MASHQEPTAPDDGQRQTTISTTVPTTTTSPPQPGAGIDWNGPAGFWIALPLTIAIVIALGLLLQ
jgi:hypothetical protein